MRRVWLATPWPFRPLSTMQKRPENVAVASNGAVLGAARTGDKTAWDEIVRRYEGSVRAAVASYRLNPADAADAVQNSWLRLLEYASTIRDPEKLGGWLTTTARRECLALIRRRSIERPSAIIDSDHASLEPTPEAVVITAETHAHVRLATDALSSRARTLIEALYYWPCGSYAEVAQHTGMPIGSIGPTRVRTMRCLRRSLNGLQP
jgi:RNA polymerase sigma factor (sigma-70 family)